MLKDNSTKILLIKAHGKHFAQEKTSHGSSEVMTNGVAKSRDTSSVHSGPSSSSVPASNYRRSSDVSYNKQKSSTSSSTTASSSLADHKTNCMNLLALLLYQVIMQLIRFFYAVIYESLYIQNLR